MRRARCFWPADTPLAEWVYEDGIGETRAALIADGTIIEARIEPAQKGLSAGTIAPAKLLSKAERIVALAEEEALLSYIPVGVTEGATLMVEIVREALPEPGNPKRARAVPSAETTPRVGPTLLERIAQDRSIPARQLHPHEPDALEAAGWTEVLAEAETGFIAFAGGSLHLSLTPAMSIFDVDGALSAEKLALAAAGAVAAAIRRYDLTGSIGVDFPTLQRRDARKAVDDALTDALPRPFEKTAINGFGFVQIVRRRERASLPERMQSDPVGVEVRAVLRRLERDPQDVVLPGQVFRYLMARPDWVEALHRRTGRPIRITEEQT